MAKNEEIKLNLLRTITSAHFLGGSILIGFLSIMLKLKTDVETYIATQTNANIYDLVTKVKTINNPLIMFLFAIGVFLFFLTFLVIYKAHDLKNNKVNEDMLRYSFIGSFFTILIFVILAIWIVFLN